MPIMHIIKKLALILAIFTLMIIASIKVISIIAPAVDDFTVILSHKALVLNNSLPLFKRMFFIYYLI